MKGFKKIFLGILAVVVLTAIGLLAWLQIELNRIERSLKPIFDENIEWLRPVYKPSPATTVYTSDGKELGSYYTDNYVSLPFDSLSTKLVQCHMAFEDPDHFTSYQKSAFLNCFQFLNRAISGKSSSLTQRLVNQLYFIWIDTPGEKNQLSQMLRNPVLMGLLEKAFSKEEIVAIYLNQIDFLYGARGIHAASKLYFGKRASQLNWQEAATIVAMLKAPALYNPKINPDKAQRARGQIFQKLAGQGIINENERDSLSQLEIELRLPQDKPSNDNMSYSFRNEVRNFLHVWQQETGHNIYRENLKVHSTLDSRLQSMGVEAVRAHLMFLQKEFNQHSKGLNRPEVSEASLTEFVGSSNRYNWLVKRIFKKYQRLPDNEDIRTEFAKVQRMRIPICNRVVDTVLSPLDSILFQNKQLHTNLLALDPATGAVRVWLSSAVHAPTLNDNRSTGTALAPIIYYAAMESNVSPCLELQNSTVAKEYYSQLPNSGLWGKMPFEQAVASIQVGAIRAWAQHLGANNISELLESLGLPDARSVPTDALLKDYQANLIDLTGAYNGFNNEGNCLKPYFISRIEDADGNIIASFEPIADLVLDSLSSRAVLSMLQKTVLRGGGMRLTSSHFHNIRKPLAGYIGATHLSSDGWFFGLSPSLTVGIWTGFNEHQTAVQHNTLGKGTKMALPIYGAFINALEQEQLNTSSTNNFRVNSNTHQADCRWVGYSQ